MLLHYIDNEVPAYGEWDSVVQQGSSSIVQSSAAAFPERPSTGSGLGLRTTTADVCVAYVQKNTTITIGPGACIYVGAWICLRSAPMGFTRWLSLMSSGNKGLFGFIYDDSSLLVAVHTAGGSTFAPIYWLDGNLHYVVVKGLRSSADGVADGRISLYVDGVLIGSSPLVDNYDELASIAVFKTGCCDKARDNFILDIDEIKIATSYPEPFVPTPLTEYPEARRTVVLYRRASADSRTFADYCVSELGVPRSNLCPLPNASANETLASYATFQAEVETDLAAWLALNPTVAANCSCFLIGYGVPGYFLHSSVKHSATSRLMNFGTVFSSATVNPLYNPSTVARLTKTGLGGKYLCARIDADTLQHAKDVLDRGLWIADCGFLPATDKLFSDEPAYRASLACQRLRIITAALGTYANDAFVFGDTGTPAFGAAGSRAVFCDDSTNSAYTLRSASPPSVCCVAVLTALYAAALGNGDAVVSVTFDAESFFEMLRLGGTLAEAVAVAVEKIDYTAVAVGSPLMTVASRLGGYNIYRGVGGADSIDYASPVAYLRAGVAQAIMAGLGHVADRAYYYGVRAVSDSGVEESGTAAVVRVIVDAGGDLIGSAPNAITSAAVEAAAGGKVRLTAYYSAIGSPAIATGLQVALVTAGVPNWAAPLQTIPLAGSRRIDVVLTPTFIDGETVRLAVRAVTAAGVGGKAKMLNPVVADSSAPADIEYAEASQLPIGN